MIWKILITILLVLLNAFFVAAEFAIVKVRSSQIDLRIRSGHKSAKITRHLIDHLNEYLSATQLGITFASLGLGWIGEPVVSKIIIAFFSLLGTSLDNVLVE
jgi:CBS domain containing-hemolysin-like protein